MMANNDTRPGGDLMSPFEIPHGLSPDLHKALAALHRCCETVQGWGEAGALGQITFEVRPA
jgi:hypothetical protein